MQKPGWVATMKLPEKGVIEEVEIFSERLGVLVMVVE
jgi:hypothetical protein